MTLSFLYRALCSVLQLIRLVGRRDTYLAIEVVILRVAGWIVWVWFGWIVWGWFGWIV